MNTPPAELPDELPFVNDHPADKEEFSPPPTLLGSAPADATAVLQVHPHATLFPMLSEKEIHKLAADIKANGLISPITAYRGAILDGRNRRRACEIAGIPVKTVEYDGVDPLAFVLSQNLSRRHLTEAQRSMVAARLATLRPGDNQHSKQVGSIGPTSKTQNELANLLSVSPMSIKRARTVLQNGIPLLSATIDAGGLSINAAVLLANLPPDQQSSTLALGLVAAKRRATGIRNSSRSSSPTSSLRRQNELAVAGSDSAVQESGPNIAHLVQAQLDCIPGNHDAIRTIREFCERRERENAEA